MKMVSTDYDRLVYYMVYTHGPTHTCMHACMHLHTHIYTHACTDTHNMTAHYRMICRDNWSFKIIYRL